MNLLWQILGAIGGLLVTLLIFETIKAMVAKEAETRLHRLPFALLRLARRRLPPAHRQLVHDEEWVPELWNIIHETEGLPITRIVRGLHFAGSLFWSSSKVSEELGDRRTTNQIQTSPSPDALTPTPTQLKRIRFARRPTNTTYLNSLSRHLSNPSPATVSLVIDKTKSGAPSQEDLAATRAVMRAIQEVSFRKSTRRK